MKNLEKYIAFKFWLYEDNGGYHVDIGQYEDDDSVDIKKKLIFNPKDFDALIEDISKNILSFIKK